MANKPEARVQESLRYGFSSRDRILSPESLLFSWGEHGDRCQDNFRYQSVEKQGESNRSPELLKIESIVRVSAPFVLKEAGKEDDLLRGPYEVLLPQWPAQGLPTLRLLPSAARASPEAAEMQEW